MSAPILMPFQELPFNGDSFVCKDFIKLKDKYNLNVAVETGSCLYSTTKWLGQNFANVHTIELSEEYSRHGIHKVAGMLNVHTNIGDSVSFLNRMVDVLTPDDKCIFFLDAHWGQNCPLLEELDVLTRVKTNLAPVIAIHDFFTGDEKLGWDEYNGQRFDYAWIEPKVKALELAHNCTYHHFYNTESENGMRGLIYLVPFKHWTNQIKNVKKWTKYSQSGEEAYIEFILNNLESKGKHLVEIGAWDGHHLSNTRHFIENGFTHLLIDGDNRGNEEVKQHIVIVENVLELLKTYQTPIEFDLLCVDIDGNDLYIIEKILTRYKPSLIVAEFNPIWRPDQSKTIKYDSNHTWQNDDFYGFSFLAGKKMAEKYGYTCVFENDSLNMYFVKTDMLDGVLPNVSYEVAFYHPRSSKNDWVDY
jgi:hypothetical protein